MDELILNEIRGLVFSVIVEGLPRTPIDFLCMSKCFIISNEDIGEHRIETFVEKNK